MLIFDSNAMPVIIDNINTPILADHFWTLDLSIMDYTLASLLVLEETVCPSIMVEVKGFRFILPANWNMLIYDTETFQLDVIQISELAGRQFTAMVYGPNLTMVEGHPVKVIDYYPDYCNVGPSLGKHQMLCHPIGPREWISVSSSDTYNKYLKDRIVQDLVG